MIEVVGHRGWPSRYPDNTLAGFIAVAGVASAVELDVRRSSDGKLVLSHDPVLSGHLVHRTPWSILAELDLGEGHHPALLDEVLAALPETPVQLEVKNDPNEPAFEPDHRLALETAERARPGDIVTSFNRETLKRVRREYPDIRTGLAIQLPTLVDEALSHCRETGHVALVPWAPLVTDPVPEDVAVYPWTVNEPSRAIELVELSVSGIITDDAATIAEAIRGIR
ncbi:MAG: glycerophosphodiester phosphodiesterase [Acidimicrobiia bacterium]|nr:glycerophosphodiester phosphodiesterase [Acidimicrobiia bacterium]